MNDKEKTPLPEVTLNNTRVTMDNANNSISPHAGPPPPYPDVVYVHDSSPQDPVTSSSTKKESIVAFNDSSSQCYVNENYVESPNIGKAIALEKLGGEFRE